MGRVIKVALKRDAILDEPRFNKGTAFSKKEREMFELRSRLPVSVNSLEEQCDRAYLQLKSCESDIKRNDFLWSMYSQNSVLFYKLIATNLKQLFPIIYTPTEAEAIENYSHLFRRSQGGIFLSIAQEDTLEEDFKSHLTNRNGNKRDIQLVVVSDGEAILGIGDQGAGGIGISTAKAVIYTLAAGIDPSKILSIVLDVGTNNQKLLDDQLYVGWRHKRVRGERYYKFLDSFFELVKSEVSEALLHFEDFGLTNAQVLLDKYRDHFTCFNDDIQGTGAVTLAALKSALQVTKEVIQDQKIIIFGAGTAGLGIARQLRDAMLLSSSSISTQDANNKFWLVDKEGLITSASEGVRESIKEFARDDWEDESMKELEDVVKVVKPNVLIGTSTKPGAFTESIIREMSKHVDRPIIFPLSNPTRLHEVQPKDANNWTNGKALIATGSPFDPVKGPNGKEYVIAECNNALIYPGIGLGAIASKATKITNSMLVAGCSRLAELSPAIKDANASLLPDFEDTKRVNLEVALAVMDQAFEDGVARAEVSREERRGFVEKLQWEPEYIDFEYDPKGES